MYNENSHIPRHLHLIWIDDHDEVITHCIESWVKMNPGWIVHLWTNEHLESMSWHNEEHIKSLLKLASHYKENGNNNSASRVYAFISDMMRYEILHAVGGFCVDANSLCIRPLEAWLFDSQFCLSAANETETPHLFFNGYLAATQEHPILLGIIKYLNDLNISDIVMEENWEEIGANTLTQIINAFHEAHNITIWPSHYFLPESRSGISYNGTGHVFARHYWEGQNNHDKITSDLATSPYKSEVFSKFPVFNDLITTPTGPRLINRNDLYVGNDLYKTGQWCGVELELLKNFISEGSVIIEAGANIGSYSVDLCRMAGISGKLLAFEPQRLVFQELVSNIALNNIPNAYCYQKGLGHQKMSLHVPKIDYYKTNNFGGISLKDERPIKKDTTSARDDREVVDIVTIDSLLLTKIDLIKMDVEGMEKNVLEGGEKTIRKFSPIIYMSSWNNKEGAEARTYLRSLGYSLYRHGANIENVLALPANSPYKTSLRPELH